MGGAHTSTLRSSALACAVLLQSMAAQCQADHAEHRNHDPIATTTGTKQWQRIEEPRCPNSLMEEKRYRLPQMLHHRPRATIGCVERQTLSPSYQLLLLSLNSKWNHIIEVNRVLLMAHEIIFCFITWQIPNLQVLLWRMTRLPYIIGPYLASSCCPAPPLSLSEFLCSLSFLLCFETFRGSPQI